MFPHHQAAVDSAQQALQVAHPETLELAEKIIAAQQKEIDQMNAS